ncbi:MAG: alpha/beta hydrolase [Atopobiaceae bacterium]
MAGVVLSLLWLRVAAIVVLVLAFAVGFRVMHELLRRFNRSELSKSEHNALADAPASNKAKRATNVVLLGSFLARRAHELPFGAYSILSAHEQAVIDQNRKNEAKLTASWRQTAGDLDVVTIEGSDKARLVGHVLACAPDSHRWVILAHDYHGHWNNMMLYARSYAERGFNLLIPEMRAHGLSEGRLIGLGWLDRLDLIAWCRWIVSQKDEGARIVLHGHSMGGVAACLAACDKLLPSGVQAAIVDCPYSDAWNMLLRALRGSHLPTHPTAEMVRLLLKLTPGGYDLANASAVEAVEHAQVPTLIIHGEKDNIVPAYMSKKIYDHVSGSASGENRCLRMFAHAGHCQAVLSDPKTYYHEVFSFLKPRI